MNNSKSSRRVLLVMAILVGLLSALSIALAANLLVNGGFNAAFVSQSGINGVVPSNWTAVNLYGNPKWIDSFTYCNCGGNNEKTEGTNAVVVESQCKSCTGNQFTSGWPFTAVLVQQVNGVASGMDYSFAAAMLTFCGGTAAPSACDPRGYTMTKQIGIDPTGGISPTAPSVVWSDPNGVDHRWQDMMVAARAQSSALSVFIKVTWPYTMDRSQTYWDAAYLTLAPTATLSASANAGSGVITLNWLGRAPQDVSGDYPGIQLGYDVQVRTLPSGAWTNLLTTTTLLKTTFSGQPGTNYQFRVLPVLFEPDGSDTKRRFIGLYTDPLTVTLADVTPPSSAVAALPTLQTSSAFSVNWSGTDDVSSPTALRYDIQSRDGAGGAWTDWLTNTLLTTALFNGQPGHTYYFRSRAHDEAANVEAVHPNADAFTTVVVGSVSGTIRNVREQPIPVAAPSLSPLAANATLSNLNGQYTLYVTASNTYSLNVIRSGFGTLPPLGNLVVTTNNLTSTDVILRPATDLIVNGQFETGNLSGWTTGGANPPGIVASGHSGSYAVALGTTGGGSATLQQSLFVSPTLAAPTLSYLYRAQAGVSVPFTVTVTGSTTTQLTPGITGTGWTHGWLDLSPFVNQNIAVTFALSQPPGTQSFFLDEAEVGSAETNTTYTYLPLIFK